MLDDARPIIRNEVCSLRPWPLHHRCCHHYHRRHLSPSSPSFSQVLILLVAITDTPPLSAAASLSAAVEDPSVTIKVHTPSPNLSTAFMHQFTIHIHPPLPSIIPPCHPNTPQPLFNPPPPSPSASSLSPTASRRSSKSFPLKPAQQWWESDTQLCARHACFCFILCCALNSSHHRDPASGCQRRLQRAGQSAAAQHAGTTCDM